VSGRWWENYLVRYFMPSIAGVGIVAWLMRVEPSLREVLFFGNQPLSLDAPTLTLLILYGNLFCYVASYPILCFHATRVIDFDNYEWKHGLTDGYIVSGVVVVLIFVAVNYLPGMRLLYALFALTALYSIIQCVRFVKALNKEEEIKGYKTGVTSLAFAYITALSQRRGIISEEMSKEDSKLRGPWEEFAEGGETDSKRTKVIATRRHKEFIDTYRHMREHGNSAFIFVLEFSLAAETYGVMKSIPNDAVRSLSVLAGLYVTWSFPAIFVHLLGQHLERRFSVFDSQRQVARSSVPKSQ
jgi:hypothetical protein